MKPPKLLEKQYSFWQEFRDFAFKGNVVDLAIGIIIGAAFNDLVQSLVNDLIMPPIGKLLGNVNFENLYIDLSGKGFATLKAAEEAGAPVIRYGSFISEVIDFLILALTIFLVLKVFLGNKKKEEEKK